MQYLKAMLLAAAMGASSAAAAAEDIGANQAVQRGPAPTWATPSEPMAVPADASGLIFVRQQDNLVHLDEKGETTYIGQRVKLLHPQALQIGNVAIEWNPAVGAPTVHALRIYRDGAAIEVLDASKFEVLRREGQLEEAMLSGTLTAVLRVPDLRVGDELEFAYSAPSGDATLGGDSAGAMMLAGTTLPGRYHLGISWEAGQQPQIRATDDFGAPAARSAGRFDIQVDNPPTLSPPNDAPPRFSWQRTVEYTDFASWQALSKRFAPLFAQAARLEDASPLKAEAARIAAAHPGQLERAQAALALVQEQVRYVYVGLDGGNYRPVTADETWRRRYGDCKGKSVLLLALLGELGVPATAVLASNAGADDGLDQRLPSPAIFDHVLVQASLGGQTYWLDGTMPGVVEMRTRPLMSYRWVLPLSAQGSAPVAIAQAPATLPQEMGLFEIDARAGFEKPAKKTQTIVKRGVAGVAEYMQMAVLSPGQIKEAFQNAIVGGTEWDAIEDVTYRYDRGTQASILSIVGTGPVDWDKGDDGSYQLVLPGGGFSPPDRRQRSGDRASAAPYYSAADYSCYATTVRLPEGTNLANWGFNTVFDTKMYGRVYYRMMELRDDRTIRLVRGSRVEDLEIGADVASRDNARLERFDNSKANITFDPGQKMKPWGRLSPVPATYEVDWTGDHAPCLPQDVIDAK